MAKKTDKTVLDFLNEENLDDMAWCIGVVAGNMELLEDTAREADPELEDGEEDDDFEDVDITLPGQVFIALFNSHMLAYETLFEAGLISEDDMEKRISRLFGDGAGPTLH